MSDVVVRVTRTGAAGSVRAFPLEQEYHAPSCQCAGCGDPDLCIARDLAGAARRAIVSVRTDMTLDAMRALRADLGLSADEARELVSRELLTGPLICPGCGFTFAGRVPEATRCQYCGQEFPAVPDDIQSLIEIRDALGAMGPPLLMPPPEEKRLVLRPCDTAPAPAEPPDPAAALRAGIHAEPLGLDQAELDRLAPYGQAGPGLCRECRFGAVVKGSGLCWYCGTAVRLADEAAAKNTAQAAHELVTKVQEARAATCRHTGRSGSFIRDGRCRRCGRFAAQDPGSRHPHRLLWCDGNCVPGVRTRASLGQVLALTTIAVLVYAATAGQPAFLSAAIIILVLILVRTSRRRR